VLLMYSAAPKHKSFNMGSRGSDIWGSDSQNVTSDIYLLMRELYSLRKRLGIWNTNMRDIRLKVAFIN